MELADDATSVKRARHLISGLPAKAGTPLAVVANGFVSAAEVPTAPRHIDPANVATWDPTTPGFQSAPCTPATFNLASLSPTPGNAPRRFSTTLAMDFSTPSWQPFPIPAPTGAETTLPLLNSTHLEDTRI